MKPPTASSLSPLIPHASRRRCSAADLQAAAGRLTDKAGRMDGGRGGAVVIIGESGAVVRDLLIKVKRTSCAT